MNHAYKAKYSSSFSFSAALMVKTLHAVYAASKYSTLGFVHSKKAPHLGVYANTYTTKFDA